MHEQLLKKTQEQLLKLIDMKHFLLSDLREFAAILKIEGKDAMLGHFKSWYRKMVYEFCRREQICCILRSYYGSVDSQWNEVDTLAEQDYRQDTDEALSDICERGKQDWFERIYHHYHQRFLILKKLQKRKKRYGFFKLWKAKYLLKKADCSLSLRDLLQIACSVYIRQGGKLASFNMAMRT